MRWVKDPLPPRERARWLLITMRLSASSFAGTARTLVAVGTVSETFMFLTTAADAPRRGDCLPAATGAAGVLVAGAAGLALAAGAAACSGSGGGGAGGGRGGGGRGGGGGPGRRRQPERRAGWRPAQGRQERRRLPGGPLHRSTRRAPGG